MAILAAGPAPNNQSYEYKEPYWQQVSPQTVRVMRTSGHIEAGSTLNSHYVRGAFADPFHISRIRIRPFNLMDLWFIRIMKILND